MKECDEDRFDVLLSSDSLLDFPHQTETRLFSVRGRRNLDSDWQSDGSSGMLFRQGVPRIGGFVVRFQVEFVLFGDMSDVYGALIVLVDLTFLFFFTCSII